MDYDTQISLKESVNGKVTGYFNGTYWTGSGGFGIEYAGYEGVWTSPNGKHLDSEVSFGD